MPLARSDSSQSVWVSPHGGDEMRDDDVRDQRRIRHLSAVLVRNLTLDPRRDELLSGPPLQPTTSFDAGPPTSARTPFFTDLFAPERPAHPPDGLFKGGRRRAGSNASWTGEFGTVDEAPEREEREVVLNGKASPGPRTRARRSSSAATLLTRPSTAPITEDDEPVSPSAPPPALPTSVPLRARSASRLSTKSNNSTLSTSTIREAPRLPPSRSKRSPPASERPPHPSSAHFAAKEKQQRSQLVRRRVLDSFVSLELVPPDAQAELDPPPATPASPTLDRRRPRGSSVLSVSSPLVPASSASSSRMERSNSGSSVASFSLSSPRKAMRRRRTVSSSLIPSTSSLSLNHAPAPPPDPFFVSPLVEQSMNPTFCVDRSHFVLPSSSDSALDAEDEVATWPGLRDDRVRAKVFVRMAPHEGESSVKGKGRATEEDEDGWKCLIEWNVALDGLTSLGRDPTTFPSLPPNTLIFALSPSASFPTPFTSSAPSAPTTDLEYFTAPLPLLHTHARSSRRRRARTTSSALDRGAVSEDELDLFDGGSSGAESAEEGDAADPADEGNLSDPGVGAGSGSGAGRARSGTLTLSRRANERKRLLARELRAAEEARRRREVVEKSRRETRMVRPAEWGDVRSVWEGERELEALKAECGAVRARVERVLSGGGGGEQGWAEMSRERAELRDAVEDLEACKEAVDEEVAEAVDDLATRRAKLRARRERLERAKALDEANLRELERKKDELDADEESLADLSSSSLTRRTKLITLLSHIFPIEPAQPTVSSPSPPPLLFTIHDLPLPNSSFPFSYSDDELSSALGYAAQLTHMLAAYLGVPLVYPIRCAGSRSTVFDGVSRMKGVRAFPLYGKGVEQYRFDYAVFLLNKNIEQLMYSQRLTCLDLRNTLPNLKTLVLSLSYDPSHADYASSTLLPEAPFAADEDVDDARPPSPASDGSTASTASSTSFSARPASASASSTPESTPDASTASLPDRDSSSDTSTPEASAPRISRSPSLASTIRVRSQSPTPTVRANGAEKRPPPRSSSPTPPALPSKLPSTKLKHASGARERSSSGSSAGGGGGYGKLLADGLWGAVAGGSLRGRARGSLGGGAGEAATGE
ncbi:hypothetical protein JCM10207_008551 [Rhodosporidiobolus poonsookiae]